MPWKLKNSTGACCEIMKNKTCILHPERLFALKILNYLKDCKKILDAGSGSGAFGRIFVEFLPYADFVGIDLNIPSHLYKSDNFLKMNVEYLGLKPSSFDCIMAKDIIEHLINPLKVMKQFNRILTDAGKIIVLVPSDAAPFLWDDYTHIRPFTKKSLCKLLNDSNFNVIDSGYLAASTPGASFFLINRVINLFAKIGIRRGNVWAVGQKL